MRYQGNYRLTDNPRAKMSHKLRSMMKMRDRRAACLYGGNVTPALEKVFNANPYGDQKKGGAKCIHSR